MGIWTEKEIAILVENYNQLTNDELLKLFPGRTSQAIYKRAYKIGLRKEPQITFRNKSNAKSGTSAYNWNGGKTTNRKGYILKKRPGHHRADKNGYVMEHILVWEEATGIQVPKNCCIHHLNGIKSDNRIENLCLMEYGAHTTYHHMGSHHSEETKEKISKKRRKKIC